MRENTMAMLNTDFAMLDARERAAAAAPPGDDVDRTMRK